MTRDRHPTYPYLPVLSGPTTRDVADSYVDSHLAHVWSREDVTATNPCLRAITDTTTAEESPR